MPRLLLLVVLSASMGSALPVGSLAVAVPQSEYQAGDVVTFKIPNSDELLTHRINSVSSVNGVSGVNGTRIYKTRGDANNVIDDWELIYEDVIGRIVFHIPYLGYLFRLPQLMFQKVFPIVTLKYDEIF